MNKIDLIIDLERDMKELDRDQLSSEDAYVLRRLMEKVEHACVPDELKNNYAFTKMQIKLVLDNQKNHD